MTVWVLIRRFGPFMAGYVEGVFSTRADAERARKHPAHVIDEWEVS